MSQLPAAFDANQHEDMRDGFEAISAAICAKTDFPSHVTGSEIKDTKAKTGKYIAFEFTILDGEFKGRKIWNNINIINPNPLCVEIGQKELATLTRACGKGIIQDTQELHAIPFMLKLKFVPAKNDYPAKNEPAGYAPIGGKTTAASAEGDGDPGAQVDTGKPPWAKK